MSDDKIVFPRDGQGFRAEVKLPGFHVVLLTTHSAMGPGASVYDATNKRWAFREWVDNFEDGKAKAENYGRKFHRAVGIKEAFPALEWNETG
jgi:hypothetical protein